MNAFGELEEELRNLQGEKCWGVVAGEGTGSVIALDFGGKLARARPLKNPNLTQEQRHFEAERSLLIESAWRLESDAEVLCGSTDSNEAGGPMLAGLERLIGSAVRSAELIPPAGDLILSFQHDLVLRVFCDQTDIDSDKDNYSVFGRDVVWSVGPRGRLSRQPRATKR